MKALHLASLLLASTALGAPSGPHPQSRNALAHTSAKSGLSGRSVALNQKDLYVRQVPESAGEPGDATYNEESDGTPSPKPSPSPDETKPSPTPDEAEPSPSPSTGSEEPQGSPTADGQENNGNRGYRNVLYYANWLVPPLSVYRAVLT